MISLQQRETELASRIARQRQARQERDEYRASILKNAIARNGKDAAERRDRFLARPQTKNDAAFWENVDTTGECHLWTGSTHWDDKNRCEYPMFTHPECETKIGTRIAVYLTQGQHVPDDHDVTPICNDHLCCNVDHFLITAHGGSRDRKLRTGKPPAVFFKEKLNE